MKARANLIERSEFGDPPDVCDAARMHDGRADVVDQLLADKVLAVPDRVEHFADSELGRGVLPDQAERILVFGRRSEGLSDFAKGYLEYLVHVMSYVYIMTDKRPGILPEPVKIIEES